MGDIADRFLDDQALRRFEQADTTTERIAENGLVILQGVCSAQ